jgi:hypothetical protein
MNRSIEQKKSHRVLSNRTLAAVGELRLTAGQSVYHELPEGFWSVTYREQPEGGLNHLITLGIGYPPGAVVQGLAFGIAPADDPARFQRVSRTDRRGQAWIEGLEHGQAYRVRYVPSVRAVDDVAVLAQLGDDAAQETLEAASHDPTLASTVREQAAAALRQESEEFGIISMVSHLFQRSREGERNLPASSLRDAPWSRWGALSVSDVPIPMKMAARSDQPELALPPLPVVPSIELRGHEVVVRQATKDVPYGLVCLLALGRSSLTFLGNCLLAMKEYPSPRGGTYRAGKINTDVMLLGLSDPLGIDYHAVPVSNQTMSWFRANEIERLLKAPPVVDDPSLRADVERLLGDLRRQSEASHGRDE